ncbi:hypothetical protein [Paludisphaera rhizosphaerae]|uniref:hypothetical protein n=1 Tax=Paludisphaera rhizosphaerae TaxID=2711216 RepID=UPI0013EB2797|nr:hypothetical protein [Paludisphaera rhizosphaerae]
MPIRPAILFVVGLILVPIVVDGQDGDKKPPPQRKVYSRHVDLKFRNSPGDLAPHAVTGKGGFPVRLEINDEGRSPAARRLQVLVTVFKKADPTPLRAKTGERILIKADPRILTTPPDQDRKHSFDLDLPLPPGDYVAHVFICDPDRPYRGGRTHKTFPAPEEFPGELLHATSVVLHVDPADEAAKK